MFRKDELGQGKGKGEEKNSVRTSAILKNEKNISKLGGGSGEPRKVLNI